MKFLLTICFILLGFFVQTNQTFAQQAPQYEITDPVFFYEPTAYDGLMTEQRQILGTEICSGSTGTIVKNPYIRNSNDTRPGMISGDLVLSYGSLATKPTFQQLFASNGSGNYFWVLINPGNCQNVITNGVAYAYFSLDSNGLATFNNGSYLLQPTPNPTTVTGQTRVVSISPNTGSVASTTQKFTSTYENAQPNATKVCIVWQQQGNNTTYDFRKHCENVVVNGITTMSTTTKLNVNGSYLFKTEIYTTSTTTPYISSEIRYLTVGTFQWSPLFRDATSTIFTDPTSFCNGMDNASKGICKVAMYIMAVPSALVTNIYSLMVTTITSTPPVSWYFDIKKQLESIQYSKQVNAGFTLVTPFNTHVTFLTQNQLNMWTGGFLPTLRGLTTISLIIAYLMYLINRVLYKIF